MRRTMLASLVIVGLFACSDPMGPGPVTPSTVAETVDAQTEALYVAEAAYNVPAQAYVQLDEAGKLSPQLKARVQPWLVKAYQALAAARAAYTISDAVTFRDRVRAAEELADEALKLLPAR